MKRKRLSGFTLIELILYVGASAALILIISIMLSIITSARVKNQTILEVEQQGAFIVQRIAQTIRNADAITTPAPGESAATLNLAMPNAPENPTIFDTADGAVRIQEGASPSVALTSPRVVATSLVFENLSRTATPGTIRITLTLEHVNPYNRNEYQYAKTFVAGATVR